MRVLIYFSVAAAILAGCDKTAVVRVGPKESVRTPAEARDAVRAIRLKHGGRLPSGGVVVEFADGEYRLDEPLALDERDGGEVGAPVVWKAQNRGKAVFTGARALSGWTKPSDSRALDLLPKAAKPHVLAAKVPDGLEIPDFHGGGEEVYAKRLNFPLWLYQDGKRLDCARYPNRPADPRELKPGYIFTGYLVHGKHGAEFLLRNFHDKLVAWKREPYLWAYGLFLHEYADMKMRVASIDIEKDTMKLDNRWYPRGFAANRPFHVFNALSELDLPGEWVMDREKRTVYLWPAADVAAKPPVLGVTMHLVTATNLQNMVFEGLGFRHCRRDAMRFDGCRGVRVRASTFAHTGAWGVTVNGGSDCRFEGCDLIDLGEGGIRLSGGDWKTLTPGGHVADNNHISHYGEVIPSYRPGVSLAGVGNRCSHNLIHHTRHQAVWFNGNDHYIGFNVIHDTCLYNDDAGAVYCCQRDFTKRGTVIEHNFIHATGKRPIPTNVHCIYLDDWSSGTIVRGNIMNQASWALHLGGGQGTVASNNLSVACESWCHLETRRWTWQFPNGVIGTDSQFYRKLAENAALWESPEWKGRYPHMLDPLRIGDKVLAHDPINCDIEHNMYWACDPETKPRFKEIWPHITVKNNVAVTNDPGFVNYAGTDFNFSPGSVAWTFFGGNSRFAEMGLYDSPYRASPAVRFGDGVSPVEMRKGGPRQVRQAAVIRIDVVVDGLPDGVKEIASRLDNAFILASSKGKRIVGFSESDEAPYDCHWEACRFSFVPNFDCTATISLSGRFGQLTDYRNVKVTGAELNRSLEGSANHNKQKSAKLTLHKGREVIVDFEARAHPDAE